MDHFTRLSKPNIDISMDASNEGVCALDPAAQQFLHRRSNDEEKAAFHADNSASSINVRELLSATLVVLHWGP